MLFECPNFLSVEGFYVQSNEVPYRYRLELVNVNAGIDSRCIGLRIAILFVMEADMRGVPTRLVDAIAPVLCASLREWGKMQVNIST